MTYRFYNEGEHVEQMSSPSPNGKWGLKFGSHAGTQWSRWEENAEFEYESFDDCKRVLLNKIRDCERMGYVAWFACAYAPDGTRHELIAEVPYSN